MKIHISADILSFINGDKTKQINWFLLLLEPSGKKYWRLISQSHQFCFQTICRGFGNKQTKILLSCCMRDKKCFYFLFPSLNWLVPKLALWLLYLTSVLKLRTEATNLAYSVGKIKESDLPFVGQKG